MAVTRQIGRRPFLALISPFVLRSETAALNLRVTTAGRPTAARIYVTGQDGKQLPIPGAISYARRVETHSIVDGSAVVSLAPGKYAVRAEKGPKDLRQLPEHFGMAAAQADYGAYDVQVLAGPVLAHRPNDVSVLLLAGRAYLNSAQLARAEEAFTRVLTRFLAP
jgi:hypothetical protein